MLCQSEILIATKLRLADAACLPVKLEEADNRTDAYAALLRGFWDGSAAFDRFNYSSTQILRIWLRHPC